MMYNVKVYKVETPFATNFYTGKYYLGNLYIKANNADEAVSLALEMMKRHGASTVVLSKCDFEVREVA